MKFFITPKTKNQEKIVKKILEDLDISFTMAEEEQAVYKTTPKKQLTKKEKQIFDNLSQSVDFVKKYNKGKVRAKSFNQLSPAQLKELEKAIEEADNKETISWGDFKKEMKEWKKSEN